MYQFDIEHEFETEMRDRRERVRAKIITSGREDVLAEYDRDMRNLDLGITGAQNTWHSLSLAQRRIVRLMATKSLKLMKRRGGTIFDARTTEGTVERVTTIVSVRALIARGIVQCEGGAFDPESIVSLTEKGKFTWDKGRETVNC
jgi:hypothetical protein